MKRLKGLVFLAGFFLMSLYSQNNLIRAREYFFLAGTDPCQAERLIEITASDPSPQHVILAYRGAAYTMLADCIKAPWKKLESFNKGKQIIEKAVGLNPANLEIRFVRFMVQDRAPDFLNYDNRKEDLSMLVDAFDAEKATGIGKDFMEKMAASIASSEYPDREQKKIISDFMNH